MAGPVLSGTGMPREPYDLELGVGRMCNREVTLVLRCPQWVTSPSRRTTVGRIARSLCLHVRCFNLRGPEAESQSFIADRAGLSPLPERSCGHGVVTSF